MKAVELISIQRNPISDDNILITIVICLLFICVLKYLFSTNYKLLVNKNEYLNIKGDNVTMFSFSINGLILLQISLLLISYFKIDFSYFPLFKPRYLVNLGITYTAISTIMLLRFFIEIIFYRIFYKSSSITFYMKNSSFINAKNVFLLMIICFLFFYTKINNDYLIIIGFILLLLNRIIEIYNIYSKQISSNKSIWYYNIIYLCTLEILPLAVFIKLLTIGKVI